MALVITGIIIGTSGDESTAEARFIIGLVLVFAVSALLVLLLLKTTKNDGSIKCKYDERQELVRGRGFKYALFTIGAIIGMMVYVIYAIWNEAYFL